MVREWFSEYPVIALGGFWALLHIHWDFFDFILFLEGCDGKGLKL